MNTPKEPSRHSFVENFLNFIAPEGRAMCIMAAMIGFAIPSMPESLWGLYTSIAVFLTISFALINNTYKRGGANIF